MFVKTKGKLPPPYPGGMKRDLLVLQWMAPFWGIISLFPSFPEISIFPKQQSVLLQNALKLYLPTILPLPESPHKLPWPPGNKFILGDSEVKHHPHQAPSPQSLSSYSFMWHSVIDIPIAQDVFTFTGCPPEKLKYLLSEDKKGWSFGLSCSIVKLQKV